MKHYKAMSNSSTSIADTFTYDYIIAGAGGAGLSLLHYLMNAPSLSEKSILVIDKSFNKTNDRTWCFWEKDTIIFNDLVVKHWETISIQATNFKNELPTTPYSYKMIQGIDFYNFILTAAKQNSNIHWRETTVLNLVPINLLSKEEGAKVEWEGGEAIGKYVFSSILPFQMNQLASAAAFSKSLHSFDAVNKYQTPFLWQHFKGRVVQYDQPVFNVKVATLMDFNVPQFGATAFMYQLPLNDKEALVEYTLFSDTILKNNEYDQVLDNYLNTHFPELTYTVLHEEIGAIPMTQIALSMYEAPIYSIGALGAAVKASTGYAFQFIQEQCKNIVMQLEKNKPIETKVHTTRHQFYDAVLLHILFYHKMEGAEIFKRIFAKNKAVTVFKFLSNTSSILEDIQIMRSLPTRIFLPAALRVFFGSR
jgi:lycopene beta-cyclase